jgi:hypothetical protein
MKYESMEVWVAPLALAGTPLILAGTTLILAGTTLTLARVPVITRVFGRSVERKSR